MGLDFLQLFDTKSQPEIRLFWNTSIEKATHNFNLLKMFVIGKQYKQSTTTKRTAEENRDHLILFSLSSLSIYPIIICDYSSHCSRESGSGTQK